MATEKEFPKTSKADGSLDLIEIDDDDILIFKCGRRSWTIHSDDENRRLRISKLSKPITDPEVYRDFDTYKITDLSIEFKRDNNDTFLLFGETPMHVHKIADALRSMWPEYDLEKRKKARTANPYITQLTK